MRKSSMILGIGAMSFTLLGGLVSGLPAASAATVTPFTTLGTWTYNAPKLNPWNGGGGILPGFGSFLSGGLAVTVTTNNSLKPSLASHWTLSHGVLSVYLNPKARWSNGTPVTAQDIEDTMDLEILVGDVQATDLKSMRVVNNREIQFVQETPDPYFEWNELAQGVQPPALYTKYILPNALALYHQEQYSGKNKALLAQAKKISTRFSNMTKSLAKMNITSTLTAGPYMLKSSTPAEVLMVKNPDFALANQVKVPEVAIEQSSSSSAGSLLAGDFDFVQASGIFNGPLLKEWESNPKHGIVFGPAITSANAIFNSSFYPLNIEAVRQALTYVINREQLGKVSDPYMPIAYKIPIGGFYNMLERGALPKSWLAKLNPYNPSASKATALLKSAGFKKGSNGRWMMPNGKPFTLTVTTPGAFIARETEMAAELTAFGIPTAAKSVDGGLFNTDHPYDQKEGGYEIGLYFAFSGTASAYGVGEEQLGLDYNYGFSGTGTYTAPPKGNQTLPNGGIVKLPNGTVVNIPQTIADFSVSNKLNQTSNPAFLNLLEAENILAPGDTIGGGVLPWTYQQGAYVFPKAMLSKNWVGWGVDAGDYPGVLSYALVYGGVHPAS